VLPIYPVCTDVLPNICVQPGGAVLDSVLYAVL